MQGLLHVYSLLVQYNQCKALSAQMGPLPRLAEVSSNSMKLLRKWCDWFAGRYNLGDY